MHTTEIRVCSFHIDAFHHVNNARYLEFLEMARWEFAEQIDLLTYLKTHDYGLSIVNINIDYHAAAFLGERLRIESRVKRIGNKSITLTQKIYKQTRAAAITSADITFVVTDQTTQKSVVLEPELVNKFQAS